MVLNPITRSADLSSAIKAWTSFSQYTAKSLRTVDHVTPQASSSLEASRPPTSSKSFWLSRSKYTRFMNSPNLSIAGVQNQGLVPAMRPCRSPGPHVSLPVVDPQHVRVQDLAHASIRCRPAGAAVRWALSGFPRSFQAKCAQHPTLLSRFPASVCDRAYRADLRAQAKRDQPLPFVNHGRSDKWLGVTAPVFYLQIGRASCRERG